MPEIKLIPLNELEGWEKNPRERDPVRFEWIKVSLQKFGFVLPVYSREDGMLFSGHQRTSAARELGFDKVPVQFMAGTEEDTGDRGINILFNLCTNDHATKGDMGKALALDLGDIEQFRALPDAADPYRCMSTVDVDPSSLRDQLTELSVSQQTVAFAERLIDLGVLMPAVLGPGDRIINGRPRLAAALKAGILKYPVVKIDDAIAAQNLEMLLNKITMSFDLEKVFGGALRYNSFFRKRNQKGQRTYLGVGFYHWVFSKQATEGGKEWLRQHMTRLEGIYLAQFIAEHGTICVDFGAGRMDNAIKLQASGLTCVAFEPYLLKPETDDITYDGARAVNIQFLNWIKTRPQISSLFCSSVFNSVPFKADREHLLVLFQALCIHGATLYLTTLKQEAWARLAFQHVTSATQRSGSLILLDSEPGLLVGGILRRPKVQKFHSKEELIADGQRYFNGVIWKSANAGSHGIKCQQPKEIDLPRLVAAIEFEFDLPYPGNRTMGLVDKAIAAFSAFTGYDLAKVRAECQ